MKTEKQVRTIEFTTMRTEQGVHVVYHVDKCTHEIFMKQQDWKFIAHEDHQAIVQKLESRIEKMREGFKKINRLYDWAGTPTEEQKQIRIRYIGMQASEIATQALIEDEK